MKKFAILFFSFAVITISCTKNTISVKVNDLAGTWSLKKYSGGFAGGIYTPKDAITISFTSSKAYTSSRNDTTTANGTYTITKAGDPNYYYSGTLINLVASESDKITYGIVLRNDSLFLDEGCCDRFSYVYTRKN